MRIDIASKQILFFIAAIIAATAASATAPLFSSIDSRNGLSDNNVRITNQLPDGRMVFVTTNDICLYDGNDFKTFKAFPDSATIPLAGYTGCHHIYIDSRHRLWLKDRGRLSCLDLTADRFLQAREIEEFNAAMPADIFVDDKAELWTVIADTLLHPSTNLRLPLRQASDGVLQDIALTSDTLYLFQSAGLVKAYLLPQMKQLLSQQAYSPEKLPDYGNTALTLKGPGGFYQLRNGRKGGFFHFDTERNLWRQLMETDYTLNTLAISADGHAYVSCAKGIWVFCLPEGKGEYTATVLTDHGTELTTAISTVFEDRQGGLWLGTIDRGLLYNHPTSHSAFSIPLPRDVREASDATFAEDHWGNIYFATPRTVYRLSDSIAVKENAPLPDTGRTETGKGKTFVARDGTLYLNCGDNITVYRRNSGEKSGRQLPPPLLTGVRILGENATPGQHFGKHIPLTATPGFANSVELDHDRNFITLEYSSLDFVDPSSIAFRYQLEGIDRQPVTIPAGATANGTVSIPYTNLPPGTYALSVETSTDGFKTSNASSPLTITVHAPWWRTRTAFAIYIILLLLAAAGASRLHTSFEKRKLRQRHKEEILLLRIKNLIERCEAIEATSPTPDPGPEENPNLSADRKAQPLPDKKPEMTAADSAFITRAIELVEQNLNTPGYSVVQLSSDLCMERTGLYRKLTALLDQSPSLFIRNIRLRHAANLLKTDSGLSIGEIAERTGFSTTSYMSKCFQEVYGCRPSEYTARQGKST